MIALLIILSILFTILLSLRLIWLNRTMKSFIALSAVYFKQASPSKDQQVRLLQFWPWFELVFNFKYWEIRHFMYYPEEMDEMLKYFLSAIKMESPEIGQQIEKYLNDKANSS